MTQGSTDLYSLLSPQPDISLCCETYINQTINRVLFQTENVHTQQIRNNRPNKSNKQW